MVYREFGQKQSLDGVFSEPTATHTARAPALAAIERRILEVPFLVRMEEWATSSQIDLALEVWDPEPLLPELLFFTAVRPQPAQEQLVLPRGPFKLVTWPALLSSDPIVGGVSGGVRSQQTVAKVCRRGQQLARRPISRVLTVRCVPCVDIHHRSGESRRGA